MEDFDYSQISKGESKLRKQFNKGLTVFVIIAACILFYILLSHIGDIWSGVKKVISVLAAVWFGCAFAYLLNPLMKRIEQLFHYLTRNSEMKPEKKQKASRIIGVSVSMIVFLAIIVLLINMLIPQLYSSIKRLVVFLPQQINHAMKYVESLDVTSNFGNILVQVVEEIGDAFMNWIKGGALSNINDIVGSVYLGVKSTITWLLNFIIGIIIAVYILLSKEKFAGQSKKLLYAINKREKANFLMHLASKSNQIFGGFVIGKLVDSLIIGCICFICMSIFRFTDHYTLLVSVIIGVTNIIPFFGPFIGAIPSAFLIMLESPLHGLYFIIFIILLQQLDGNVIGPKILGESTGLSSFWVVVSILLGGGLFGFMGMLLGVPVMAVIYYIIDMIISDKLRRQGLPTETEDYVKMKGVQGGKLLYPDENPQDQDEEIRKGMPINKKIKVLWRIRKKKLAKEERQKLAKETNFEVERIPDDENNEDTEDTPKGDQ